MHVTEITTLIGSVIWPECVFSINSYPGEDRSAADSIQSDRDYHHCADMYGC